jgi:hybrid cluster-associated redox disulfide protein
MITMNNNNNLQWHSLFQALQLDIEVFSEILGDFHNKRKPNRFTSKMTIEQALQFHPDAKKIFQKFGLPRCNKCTVRFEETLEEAAEAYDIDLSNWISNLNQLIPKTTV